MASLRKGSSLLYFPRSKKVSNPAWDSSISDLSVHRATEAEIRARKARYKSKHLRPERRTKKRSAAKKKAKSAPSSTRPMEDAKDGAGENADPNAALEGPRVPTKGGGARKADAGPPPPKERSKADFDAWVAKRAPARKTNSVQPVVTRNPAGAIPAAAEAPAAAAAAAPRPSATTEPPAATEPSLTAKRVRITAMGQPDGISRLVQSLNRVTENVVQINETQREQAQFRTTVMNLLETSNQQLQIVNDQIQYLELENARLKTQVRGLIDGQAAMQREMQQMRQHRSGPAQAYARPEGPRPPPQPTVPQPTAKLAWAEPRPAAARRRGWLPPSM